MQDLNNLYYFAQVIENRSFAAASRALGIPKSKLSRRISRLEKELGVRLIQRSSRQFSITEVGERYYQHCRAMLIEAESAQAAIDSLRDEPCGTIRMTCPIGLLNFHVGDMLAQFMVRYPKVAVQLEATNRRVDVLGEGIDIALRVRPRPLEDSDLALRILSDRGQCLVANPALVERFGLPDSPEALARWPSMSRATPQENHQWILADAQGTQMVVPHVPRYITTDMSALLMAAKAGVGIVQLPALMVEKYIEEGELVHVLPQWTPRREVIHIVFPTRRGLLPSVRALIDFLAERYAAIDED
jgi:DNA-binding transcriptional LysR family regulator